METEMKCLELKKMFSDREIKEMREIFSRKNTKCMKNAKKSRKNRK